MLRALAKIVLPGAGALLLLFVLWTAAGLPLLIDRLCFFSEAPVDAEHIVCVCAGLAAGNLPTDDGWRRIYTAVQLYLDGYGRKIIFTGGGAGRVSEAEVYAEAALWLGMGAGDALLDPVPGSTAEHPANVLKIPEAGISTATPLDIVTSPLHSRRTALCFKKAGFSHFRLVTEYSASGRRTAVRLVPSDKPGEPPAARDVLVSRPDAPAHLREERSSGLSAFKRSGKSYDDFFIRMRQRTWTLFTSCRELAAMAAYKLKGLI